jgi:hypothetical protein
MRHLPHRDGPGTPRDPHHPPLRLTHHPASIPPGSPERNPGPQSFGFEIGFVNAEAAGHWARTPQRRSVMSTILIVILVILLLGGFGGYHGYSRYGGAGLGGVLGLVLVVVVVLWLVGGVHV